MDGPCLSRVTKRGPLCILQTQGGGPTPEGLSVLAATGLIEDLRSEVSAESRCPGATNTWLTRCWPGREEVVVEKLMWLVLGGTAFVAALQAGHSRRARYVGRWALGVLFIVFGAAVNAVYLAARPGYYEDFAKSSPFAFVRDTWESLVLPQQDFFISLLIIAEAIAGVLVLMGGPWTRAGLIALIGFHVGQLAFGGVMWIWAPLMLVTLVLLLRAERQAGPQDAAQHSAPRAGWVRGILAGQTGATGHHRYGRL